MARVTPNARASPHPMPSAARRIPVRTTIPRTCRRAAPSAMRTPISLVRCPTPYDMTP